MTFAKLPNDAIYRMGVRLYYRNGAVPVSDLLRQAKTAAIEAALGHPTHPADPGPGPADNDALIAGWHVSAVVLAADNGRARVRLLHAPPKRRLFGFIRPTQQFHHEIVSWVEP